MRIVQSYAPIDRVSYFTRGSGKLQTAIAYLHENIKKHSLTTVLGEEPTSSFWQADEVMIETTLTKEEVEANFDALWVQAERDRKPLEKRLVELENLLGVLIDEVLGVNK